MAEYIVNISEEIRDDGSQEILNKKPLIRCKDCKHRPKEIPFVTSYGGHDTYLEYPEGSKCPCRNSDDEYYSWNPDDDWFCGDGERK